MVKFEVFMGGSGYRWKMLMKLNAQGELFDVYVSHLSYATVLDARIAIGEFKRQVSFAKVDQ